MWDVTFSGAMLRQADWVKQNYSAVYKQMNGYVGPVIGTCVFDVVAGERKGKQDIWYYPKSRDRETMEQWIGQAMQSGIVKANGRINAGELKSWWASLPKSQKRGVKVLAVLGVAATVLAIISHSINIARFIAGK